jgi:pimeloyl-ACP methyl ester carboxylesterase
MVLINASGFWRYQPLTQLAGRLLLREKVLVPAMERLAIHLLNNVFYEKNYYTRRFISQAEGRPPQPTVGEFGRVTESLAAELVGSHFLDDLERFVLPVLVLWGDQDKLIPARGLSHWVPRLPRGRMVIFRGCGHMPIIERPRGVVDAIREFMAEELPEAMAEAAAAGGAADRDLVGSS